MKRKKLTALGLVLAVAVSICGGCTDKPGTEKHTEGYTPSKKLDITIWNTQGTDLFVREEIENNVVLDWLIDKTQVEVTNYYGNDGDQWEPKLTKLYAGNNLPDILVCGSGQGMTHFIKLDQLGKLHHLTPELIQKYAPEVWRQVTPEIWDKLTVDGKILGIPYHFGIAGMAEGVIKADLSEDDIQYLKKRLIATNDVSNVYTLWVRDDILQSIYPGTKGFDELMAILEERQEPIGEELLDIPIYSTEDYIDFCRKVKEGNYRSHSGKTVYAFGYDGGDNWMALSYLGSEMYGYKGHYYSSAWNSAKQQVEIPIAHDLVKQAAKTQAQLIRESVIDPESLVHTVKTFEEKVLDGQYALIAPKYMGMEDINDRLEKAGATFRYRPFFTQVPAAEGFEKGKQAGGVIWSDALCILNTLSEEELHQVLNWINVQFTDEYQMIKAWGPESAGLYTEDENGRRTFKDPRFTDYYENGNLDALTPQETLGLSGPHQERCGVGKYAENPFYRFSRWSPDVLNRDRIQKTTLSYDIGFSFKSDSEHVKNVKNIIPAVDVWRPEFAEIPEVVDYWNNRSPWEAKFKQALATENDEQFEEKWADAVKTLNDIVNIEDLERKMTEVAKKGN